MVCYGYLGKWQSHQGEIMKIQRQPNTWSCILASAAMVLDTDCKTLTEMIGHDGSEIVLPSLPEPAKRRGFHLQEIIDCAIKLGYTVTPIEVLPYSTPDGKAEFPVNFKIRTDGNLFYWDNKSRLLSYMKDTKGIITGLASQWRHALAWDGKKIYDPHGLVYSFQDCKIKIDCFWMFTKIKSI